jgi:hypothetical protein
MTFEFTRINADNNCFPDGDYKAKIISSRVYPEAWGRKLVVEWLISAPSEYRNCIQIEKLTIETENDEWAEHSKRKLNRFWSELTDDQDGLITDFEKIIGVEAVITIKSYISQKGVKETYVAKRSRIAKVVPPVVATPAPKNELGLGFNKIKDDEVPF